MTECHPHQVDEILFQAAVHPSQRGNTLSTSQLLAIHTQTQTVINTAVEVNADHAKFPKNWLFKYRWGKGRRNEPATFELPDGTIAVVRHETVGGRTSAIVDAVQKLIGELESEEEEEGGQSGADDEDYEAKTDGSAMTPRKMRTPKKATSTGKRLKSATPASKQKSKAARKEESNAESDWSAKDESGVELPASKATPVSKRRRKVKQENLGEESDLTALEESETEPMAKIEAVEVKSISKRKRAKKVEVMETEVALSPVKKARAPRKKSSVAETSA